MDSTASNTCTRQVVAADASIGSRQVFATRVAFLVTGIGVSIWAPLVPFAKSRLGVGDATLGLLILCLGAGSVISMPLCHQIIKRVGPRAVILLGVSMMSLALPLLAFEATVPSMAVSLLLFGAAVGLLDVSINVHALLVEKGAGRALMSGFHGLFSVGGIAGSVLGSGLLSVGVTPLVVACTVSAGVVALTAISAKALIPSSMRADGGGGFALPHGSVVAMGLVGLCVFLVEGAMLDWSALFLTVTKSFPERLAGLGYTGFAIAMAVGRLLGDALSRRAKPALIVAIGGICGAAGIVLALFAPSGAFAIAGFLLTGAGCANIVPVLFSAVGSQKAMEPGAAVAALTTMGYAGALAGPAAIGFVSHAVGLRVAFSLLAGLLVLAALVGWILFKDSSVHRTQTH
ncbi:MFS transporter [Paraburkholderia sp. Ac-20340]|uniref:MFS transporter n=1 Tax=Paraburkholderia sp. Ac-20340 TaxID=2703888 RepID=UPI00197DE02A|nr:MFS transporter [Paraburkholderia sp. Ac-20340]MBN3854000.1 MFS transporter [Paraburkholderia sp. Ac-20340]